MDLGEATLRWLHILFGTFWFGGALFANFVVVPAMMRLPAEPQQQFLKLFAEQTERMMLIAASGTIVLGIIRGTAFGEIKDVAALSTPRHVRLRHLVPVAAGQPADGGDGGCRRRPGWSDAPRAGRRDESAQGPCAPRAARLLRRLHDDDPDALRRRGLTR